MKENVLREPPKSGDIEGLAVAKVYESLPCPLNTVRVSFAHFWRLKESNK